ncbi:hypothetical protein EIN_267680 [Entamoeba invadens IP1]|uniref:Vesicle transport protein n=1 Tax=Entamoeba invadens IP1 TaxID=370355 RepID=A0A0A1UBJ3_ENTIV|nr:hypothetical protein EIN_267680 [Entamoeba invadens IP1]ELP91042.1 hypothetical protein EIN_267680 [Entamoeba invadens IP1]|eukprot:XP_004257813.1 hypothetical protein EIN_267680 [Entamoeba invadens IP1]
MGNKGDSNAISLLFFLKLIQLIRRTNNKKAMSKETRKSMDLPKHEVRDGIITLHRNTLGDIFITKYQKVFICFPLSPAVRFVGFVFSFLVGLFLLFITLPLTGIYSTKPIILMCFYIISKTCLYIALFFLASPWRQCILICRPVRFSTTAFHVIGMVGVWLTIFSVSDSVLVLILSLLLQIVMITFYCLSYLSFTHNVLFDCIKRPHIPLLKHSKKDTEEEFKTTDPSDADQIHIEIPLEQKK